MGGVQDGRRRRLVDLAALDPDEAVLDVVDPADAVGAAQVVEALDERRPAPSRSPSRATGMPPSKSIDDLDRRRARRPAATVHS